MSKRKKRSFFDEFFSPFEEFEEMFREEAFPRFEGISTGYSIEVRQEGGKTVVHAKVGKDTDVGKFREDLEKRYPGAQIIIEGGKPLIEEVREEEKPKEKKPEKKPVKVAIKWLEPKEKPLIEEIKEEGE